MIVQKMRRTNCEEKKGYNEVNARDAKAAQGYVHKEGYVVEKGYDEKSEQEDKVEHGYAHENQERRTDLKKEFERKFGQKATWRREFEKNGDYKEQEGTKEVEQEYVQEDQDKEINLKNEVEQMLVQKVVQRDVQEKGYASEKEV